MALYSSAGVRYCAGEIVWHNIDPSSGRFFYSAGARYSAGKFS